MVNVHLAAALQLNCYKPSCIHASHIAWLVPLPPLLRSPAERCDPGRHQPSACSWWRGDGPVSCMPVEFGQFGVHCCRPCIALTPRPMLCSWLNHSFSLLLTGACLLAMPCRVTGEEGATEAERRIRSFPVLENLDELSDAESPPAQPALAAAGGSPAVTRRAGQRLGQQRIQELSQRQQRAAQRMPRRAQRGQTQQGAAARAPAAAAAPAAQAAAPGEQDGAVEDYHSDEEGRQQPQQAAGPTSPGSQYSDLPPLEEDWESDEEGGAQQRGQQPQLPHADMLLLAAVCVGDLACRFLQSLGGEREGSPQAAHLAAAQRLRGLTEVPLEAGPACAAIVVRGVVLKAFVFGWDKAAHTILPRTALTKPVCLGCRPFCMRAGHPVGAHHLRMHGRTALLQLAITLS